MDRMKEQNKSVGKNDKPVLNLLLSNHGAFTAYDIAETLSNKVKRLRPIQIYRSLEKLIALGVVHRLATRNSFIACYETGVCATSQFLICTKCENVEEIGSQRLDQEIQDSANKKNFTIISKNVEVLGLCSKC
jgi:Fur family zinc uptake transcriptional regulator